MTMIIKTIRVIVVVAAVFSFVDAQTIASKCRSSFGCISSLTQDDCEDIGQFLRPNLTMGGCCPGCARGVRKCASCRGPKSVCAPGLSCNMEFKCVLNEKSCVHTSHMKAAVTYKPICIANGEFAAKQCRGDITSGRCFCYSEEGERIFGWSWWKDAEDMTCACSRQRRRLEKGGRIDVSLHCQQNGNYDEVQCETGVCWCADPKTGGIQDETTAVPESLWTYLPCYNRTLYGDNYLRQCESISFAQNAMRLKFINRGTNHVYFPQIMCDYDGTYGIYTLESGVAYCTWRDGKKIGGFQTQSITANILNCYCARDRKIFEENSLTLTVSCAGNGNYNYKQDQNGQYYCVDRHGFAVSDLVNTNKGLMCEPYIYYEKYNEECQ